MENHHHLHVDASCHKWRLDKFITEHIAQISRSKAQNLIDSGAVKLSNIAICNSSHKVKEGEDYIIEILPPPPSHLVAKDIEFEILFEDDHLIVLNKPAGLTTHPGAGNSTDTLVNALLAHCGKNLSAIGKEYMRPGIVHRLDKNTSGVMIVAKNDQAHEHLAKQIQDKELTRQYTAITHGTPKPLRGSIIKNIGRSNRDRKKMSVVEIGGKYAATQYYVTEILLGGYAAMVRCTLDTGRTHQIRVHLSHIGHPLIGDPDYGNIRNKKTRGFPESAQEYLKDFQRQALHSTYIKFTHPVTNKILEFTTDLPDDMAKLKELLQ